ncbi:unnamed protein product [Prorocentrum cordatum]|uniref:Uncharacterized protein n=1 Tax=Prorocentrum cordatum TaxID=2364126 RepID=A0ABN9TWA1_9DINO|nr:unnamed protein product [Polarella glacialis]
MASGENHNSSVDPKIPVLKGETLKDLTRYKRAVQAEELGCESKEQRTAPGPKLYRNLLGADNSISVMIEQTDPRDYAVEDGANVLLQFLGTERFAKSGFGELPQAFDTFFGCTRFERKGEEPMAAFCTAMELARRNLEEVDLDTKISSNEPGYHEDEEGDWDSSRLFYIEDEADTFLAREDDDYHQTLVTMRESRLKMNKLRAARELFEGRADGVVDESAAAGGQAAGESPGRGTTKGKDGGKSKDKRCSRCGRMDHNASDRLATGSSRKPAKGKGRGKGRQMRGPDTNYIHMQLEKDYDMMVNLDSDPIVLDRPELEAELAKYGLRPIKVEARQQFKGLDGAQRESKQKWIIPVGTGKKHVLQEYFEIPGDKVGQTSRKDLAEWKANLYVREDGRWADFQELGVHAGELVKLPGGHDELDLFGPDFESHEPEPLFERFRVDEMQLEPGAFLVAETLQEYEPGFQVKECADSRVAEALKTGSKGIFKKSTLERIDMSMKEYSVIFDVLRYNGEAFLWELFAKEARFTRVASKGGHANATPSDSSVGVNIKDPQTHSDFLVLIKTFEPWMVSVASPCAPFSNVQEFQRAQGMGDRVGDLVDEFRPWVDLSAKVLRTQAEGGRIGIGENPLASRPWDEGPIMDLLRWHGERRPLCEMVTLHQCMFGLTDDCGAPIRKVTRMPAPSGSCFPRWLDRTCDQRHERADAVGRGASLSRASAWPDDLGKTLVSAGAHELARRTDLKKLGIGDDATKATCADEGALADFSDAYADDPNFTTVELAARHPTDIVVAIYVKEPKVQTSPPATAPSLGSRPEAFKPDDCEADTVHRDLHREGESFGDRPSDIAAAQWGALRKPNLNLSHPSARALKRRLKSYGVSLKVLDAVLYYDAAKGPIAQRFAEIGEKHNILMRLAPAEAPQLKGRVERAIAFFEDHFQRLNRDVQLTRSAMEGDQRQLAAQSAALFEGGPRRAEQIRAAANRALFELDSNDAVRRATVGRVRQPRGPFVPGLLVFYWRVVKHVKSSRLQGEHGRRGPAIALAAEGHARLRLSYRGAPLLATPEQARHASRGEAEMVENEDLARQLSQWRGGPTLQKGFVDERGPGPDGLGGQRDRRPEKGDGDSDNEGAAGDASATQAPRAEGAPLPPPRRREATPTREKQCYPKYHHYLEMETMCRVLEM